MRLHAFRRALAFAVFLPLVLLSVSGGGASLFRCQLTGVVSADPCCPDEAAPVDDGAGALPATVSAIDCCQRETIAFAHPPAEAPSASGHDVSFVFSTALVAAPSLAAPSLVNFARSAPPDIIPRPPLRLVKRSLLI